MTKKILVALFFITMMVLPVSQVSAFSLNSYHVGNSLTADALINTGLPALSSGAGFGHTTGWHIRCAQSLNYIVNNPTETCVNPNATFGTYQPALTNFAWDVVTLQPFSGSTPENEYLAFKSMVNTSLQNQENADARFYVYASWPTIPIGETFSEKWYNEDSFDPQVDDFDRVKSNFDWVYDQLINDSDLQNVDIRMIPAGDVLAEVDSRMRSGIIPTHDLYRDSVHLTNLGRFAVANTFLAVLFNQTPEGLNSNSYFDTAPAQVTPIEITNELALLIQDAVWDVVTSIPETGVLVGDLDIDGFVGISDLNLVLGNWNSYNPTDSRADASGDGFVGIDDLNLVLGNWNASN